MLHSILVICLFLSHKVTAYSSGAPCLAFDTMTPNHGGAKVVNVETSNGQSPFSLRVLDSSKTKEATTYQANTAYYVEISATSPLKGLILQARENGTNAKLGEFKDETFATYCLKFQQPCGRNVESVTHSTGQCSTRSRCDAQRPCKIYVKWNSPSGNNLKPFRFVLTGVIDFSTVYTRILSKFVSPQVSRG